jgi:hypothetical protein
MEATIIKNTIKEIRLITKTCTKTSTSFAISPKTIPSKTGKTPHEIRKKFMMRK